MNTCPVYRRSGGHSYESTVPGPIGSILTPLQSPEKHSSLPFACSLCGSCTDVCPVKIPLHHQLFAMREHLDGKRLIGTGKKLQMKLLSAVFSRTWLYRLAGSAARLALKITPRFLLYSPLTPAGAWGKEREIPAAPPKSFRELYAARRHQKPQTVTAPQLPARFPANRRPVPDNHRPRHNTVALQSCESDLMPQFTTSTVLSCSAAGLRGFLGRPANLPEISDPEIELEILKAPELVVAGEKIVFRVTAMGLRQRMTHEYLLATDLEIHESLVEGPLPVWRHRQILEVVGEQQCRLTDEVTFETPGGLLRFVLTEERIRESLETGMSFRYEALAERAKLGNLV
ncbi:MAG UNVERIFIED_CONTAM: DUF3390 domain-containing protein [Planctomycetaceae bacterium]